MSCGIKFHVQKVQIFFYVFFFKIANTLVRLLLNNCRYDSRLIIIDDSNLRTICTGKNFPANINPAVHISAIFPGYCTVFAKTGIPSIVLNVGKQIARFLRIFSRHSRKVHGTLSQDVVVLVKEWSFSENRIPGMLRTYRHFQCRIFPSINGI